MIAEAAYYRAEKRGFRGDQSLDDWLAAEQQVRQVISPTLDSKVTMNDITRNETTRQKQVPADAKAPSRASDRQRLPKPPDSQDVSRFAKFASTQAAGDGIQGDVLKEDKTVDEKIGANMADRK